MCVNNYIYSISNTNSITSIITLTVTVNRLVATNSNLNQLLKSTQRFKIVGITVKVNAYFDYLLIYYIYINMSI